MEALAFVGEFIRQCIYGAIGRAWREGDDSNVGRPIAPLIDVTPTIKADVRMTLGFALDVYRQCPNCHRLLVRNPGGGFLHSSPINDLLH